MTTLLVANDGGHLTQLHHLAPRLPVEGPRLWVTTETPQTRSLLSGEDVLWVGPAGTRDLAAAVRNAWTSSAAFRNRRITAAVSTGSSLAVSVLPQVAARRIPAHYVESATRTHGPSVSGRLLRRTPGVTTWTQHASWAGDGWHYAGDIFEGFETLPVPTSRLRRVVVSLGTSRSFGFRRLLERLVAVLPADVDVLWQTGATPTGDLGIDARPWIPARDLARAMASADVVVAHAGTGVALTTLGAGKLPLLVPRRHELGEHVDDHQLLTAQMLQDRGLALAREADVVDLVDLQAAAACRVSRRSNPPPLRW